MHSELQILTQHQHKHIPIPSNMHSKINDILNIFVNFRVYFNSMFTIVRKSTFIYRNRYRHIYMSGYICLNERYLLQQIYQLSINHYFVQHAQHLFNNNDMFNICLECDLFIAVGSSLVVYPAANFPVMAKKHGAKLVILNREPTDLDPIADLVVNREIGPTLGEAANVN